MYADNTSTSHISWNMWNGGQSRPYQLTAHNQAYPVEVMPMEPGEEGA